MPRKKRRYRKANGAGSITKCSRVDGSIYYRVRAAGIQLPDGRYFRKDLGTCDSIVEAEKLLISEDEKGTNDQTIYDFFLQWTKSRKFKTISERTQKEYQRNILKFEPIIYMKIKDVRFHMIQDKVDDLINDGYYVEKEGRLRHEDYKPSTLRKIKASISKAYEEAQNNHAVDRNIIDNLDITANVKGETFTPISLDFLPHLFTMADYGDEDVMKLLVNIYTGLRPNEMCKLKKEHVYFKEGYLYGMGSKTDTGKDRKIPIFKKIEKYLKHLYLKTDIYIVGKKMEVKQYREDFFYPLMDRLGYPDNVVPYSCRHTFADILDKYKVDKEVIKQVMGHTSYVTTSDNYISEKIDVAIEEINNKIA